MDGIFLENVWFLVLKIVTLNKRPLSNKRPSLLSAPPKIRFLNKGPWALIRARTVHVFQAFDYE